MTIACPPIKDIENYMSDARLVVFEYPFQRVLTINACKARIHDIEEKVRETY